MAVPKLTVLAVESPAHLVLVHVDAHEAAAQGADLVRLVLHPHDERHRRLRIELRNMSGTIPPARTLMQCLPCNDTGSGTLPRKSALDTLLVQDIDADGIVTKCVDVCPDNATTSGGIR